MRLRIAMSYTLWKVEGLIFYSTLKFIFMIEECQNAVDWQSQGYISLQNDL